MRLFFAIDVDAAQREALREIITGLRTRSGRAVRWVDPQSAHVTLVFLGEVAATRVEELLAAAQGALASSAVPALQLAAVGAFPNLRHPQTIWLGLKAPASLADGIERLTEAQRRLAEALAALGFAREQRPYRPHLTLGRVRREASTVELQSLSAALRQLPAPTTPAWQAPVVYLYQSELAPGGAKYTRIGSVPL